MKATIKHVERITSMNELLKKSARNVVSLLKNREITPLELIDISEERITAVDDSVNALPTLCFDRARAHARRMMQQTPTDPPPHYLYGLPIAIKDIVDMQGVRSTRGSLVFKDNVPDRSDIMVQVLEENGAVVIGRSNTPEFAAGGNTFNEVFGATRNPWDTAKTCGGSSGGSATALATGQVWLATGNDLAGSLRIPASYCSVVGLRPTPGRVPYGPRPFLFDSMTVQGPMARNVEDVALMLDAQTGRHLGDPMSIPRPRTPFLGAVDHPQKPRKVAYSPNLGVAPIDPEVAEVCRKAALSWTDLGVAVEEVNLDLEDVEQVFNDLRGYLYTGNLGRRFMEDHRQLLKPEVVWNIEQGLKLSAENISSAEIARSELYQKFFKLFQEYDLLLCPAVAAKPFDVQERYLKELQGHTFDTYIGWLIMTLAITTTSCPAISVPCGFSGDGLPVGIQMVAPAYCEDRLLGAAALFEDLHGLNRLVPLDPRIGSASDSD